MRHLRFSMSLTEAVRMAWNEQRDRSFETCPSAAAFPVVLRGATSDIRCFEKIFVQHGYSPPRELGPFEPRVIIDAGANVGLATVYFASRWPDAKILAIEPEDGNFRLLERNCANFPNVIAVKGALWASSGDLSLTQRGDQPWGYAVTDRLPPQAATTVKAFSVPDLMAMAGADHVDFLKLDIEGAEKELFRRMPMAGLIVCPYWQSSFTIDLWPGALKPFIRGSSAATSSRRFPGRTSSFDSSPAQTG